jgi:hypothetical protein
MSVVDDDGWPVELGEDYSPSDVIACAPFVVLAPPGTCRLFSFSTFRGYVSSVTIRCRAGVTACRTELPHPQSLRGPRELARSELGYWLVKERVPFEAPTSGEYEVAKAKVASARWSRLAVTLPRCEVSFDCVAHDDAWAAGGTNGDTFVTVAGVVPCPAKLDLGAVGPDLPGWDEIERRTTRQ